MDIIMACIELYATTEKQGVGYPWLSKKIPGQRRSEVLLLLILTIIGNDYGYVYRPHMHTESYIQAQTRPC